MTKIKQSNLDSTVITGHTEETTVNDLDQVLIYDTSAGELRKMKRSNFIFQTPAITSISPTLIDPDGSTTTTVSVTGANIEDGFTATWIGDDGTEYTPGATTYTNSTSITVDTTATMTAANSPYDLKIVNGNGIIANATNLLTLDNPPEFANPANTNLGSVQPGATDFSALSSAAATDPDGDTVTHTVTAGSLPTGMTMGTDGSFGGTVADPLSDQDFTFTVTAATTNYSVPRQFVITLTNAAFMSATGGTVTTEGDFKVHTFTSDSTFVVTAAVGPASYPTSVDYFVLAGGGGGRGDHPQAFENGGGAGGGGFRLSNEQGPLGPFTGMPLANPTGLSITSDGTYPVTVGSGGTGPTQGSESIFSTITSTGGGGQGHGSGNPGGSGSGGHDNKPTGLGNTPPTSPPQGNNGGSSGGPRGNNMGGGGGGGALGSGSTAQGGPGGSAGYVPNSWLGSNAPSIGWPGPDGNNRYFAGGAGGSGGSNGPGGGGGAASGGSLSPAPPTTGSGAGGSTGSPSTQTTGGSGVVVLRYKFQ